MQSSLFIFLFFLGNYSWASNSKFYPCKSTESGRLQTEQILSRLKSSEDEKIVGYLKLFKDKDVVGYITVLDINSKSVQLGDLYLCTDYAHDYYYLSGDSDQLQTWQNGGRIDGVEQDEAVAVIFTRQISSSKIFIDFFARSLSGQGLFKDFATLSLNVNAD